MADKFNFKKLIKRVFIAVLALGVLGIAYVFSVNAYVKSSASNRIITAEEAKQIDADCILVLGAGVDDTGNPCLLLSDRLDTGIDLYFGGVSDRLLMSGDHGRKNYDEVNSMKNYAVEKGADAEEVFADHAGFSTYESMYRARDVFGAETIIIVTQEYHLYRALYIAEKLGLDAYGVACKDVRYYGQTYRDVREVLARNKDFLYCIIQPEPWSVGELRYPIEGNASITNG